MKYLYYILRLFKCPHKYSKCIKTGHRTYEGSKIGDFFIKECSYCGKLKYYSFGEY